MSDAACNSGSVPSVHPGIDSTTGMGNHDYAKRIVVRIANKIKTGIQMRRQFPVWPYPGKSPPDNQDRSMEDYT